MLALKVILGFLSLHLCASKEAPSFSIDYEKDTFLRNGKPHRYMSGSLHYYRVPRSLWRQRLETLRLAGLNTVQTYVEWATHEPQPNVTLWSNGADLRAFILEAQQVGLDVILRPGPFIDAERDFGGLPYWLLKEGEGKLRTSDPKFLARVRSWYTTLFSRLQGLFFHQGGPIIMVQVENEYGSYGCDKVYLANLRDLIKDLAGDQVLLFSTDGDNERLVMCGQTPGVYATVDFGPGTNVSSAFAVQRLFSPRGPLVNSEYYPGWLDHWAHPHSKVDSAHTVATLEAMLEVGASVNIYMFHGGTSFGFTAGSNYFHPSADGFQVTPTSYDYDAPVSEAGDLTEKWWAIREVVGRFMPLPPLPPDLQNKTAKAAYGRVNMHFVSTLFDSMGVMAASSVDSNTPLTFEALNQSFGLVVYDTELPEHIFPDPVLLSIPGLRDRGYIFLDYRPVGVLSREQAIFSVPLQASPRQKLQIVVENQGRVCFGSQLADRKGILGNVTLGTRLLTKWRSISLPLDDGNKLEGYVNKVKQSVKLGRGMRQILSSSLEKSEGRMTIWEGEFTVTKPLDTFLDLPGWHKGVAFLNGFNLGRYWPAVGPQMTLYVPAPLLKSGSNMLILLEQDHSPCLDHPEHCHVEFVDKPEINGPTPA